jgi:solute carrier family 25 (mitochondrial dicarboxylate transporter), member 10
MSTVHNQSMISHFIGKKVLIPAAAISGFIGALIGNPADIANVRMQNDSSLTPSSRRNYRSVIDALFKIQTEEGVRAITGVCG